MVKSLLIVIVSTCVFHSNLHAQLLRGYGVKCGVVAANQRWHYTYAPVLSTDNRWDITVSGFIEVLDLPVVSALIELQYTRKGMSESIPITTESQPDGTGELITVGPSVDYLSLPILAKLRFSTPGFTPYLIAGPRFDLLLSTTGDGYDAVVDKFRSSEYGATFGAGIEFTTLLPVTLLAEIRYNPSFIDAYKTNYLSVRNRSFDLMVGVRL